MRSLSIRRWVKIASLANWPIKLSLAKIVPSLVSSGQFVSASAIL
jgi:hypothetical protein